MKKSTRFLFFLPVIIGIAAVVLLVNNKTPPVRPDIDEQSRTVSIIEVEKRSVIPRITGHGYVTPSESWEAIPEVSGRVIEVHPELKEGTFLGEGEVLLRIDPESYGLAQSRGEASLMSAEAQLIELDQEKDNLEKLLAIEQQTLNLVKKDFQRKSNLFEQGVISVSELEKEKKNLLAQQTAVNNLENSLALIPAKKKSLQAQKQSDLSSLSELQLDMEKTVIRAPFDCRIATVNIEKNQFASAGKTLLTVIGIDAVEIPVQLAPTDFLNLLDGSEDNRPAIREGFSMERFREIVGITAEVRLPLFAGEAVWQGQFRRTGESLDLKTGALTVYVAVADPYEKVVPGKRPPLVPNMFCEVELHGQAREDRHVIPVSAVHEGTVYVVDEDKRLRRRKVSVEMVMGDVAVIRHGLDDKVRIVTTDLVPAIEGQLLDTVIDKTAMQKLAALDAGE